jgi:hypothetical protein
MTKDTKHIDYRHAVFLIFLSLAPFQDQKPSSAPHCLTTSHHVLFFNVRDQVSQPYKTTGNITFLFTLILIDLHSKPEDKWLWTDYRSTAYLAVPEKKTETVPLFLWNSDIKFRVKCVSQFSNSYMPTDTETGSIRGCESLAGIQCGTQENGNVRDGTEKLINSSSLSTVSNGFTVCHCWRHRWKPCV